MPEPILQLQPNTFLGTANPIDDMIAMTAALIGGQGDPEAEALALKYLDRASDRMNGKGVWLFGQKEKTYTATNVDFTSGSSTVLLPSDFAWGMDGVRCMKNDGALSSTPGLHPGASPQTTYRVVRASRPGGGASPSRSRPHPGASQ